MNIPELGYGKVPVVWVEIGGEVHVLYGLQPKQYECFRATPVGRKNDDPLYRHIGYGGAAGSGKSYMARAVASAVALRWPGSTGIIFRRTFDELRENHIVKFLAEVPTFGNRLYRFNKQEKAIYWFNGSRTLFGYLQREDDVFKYQGPEYDLEIFEEATHYSWNQVTYLTKSRLRGTVPGVMPFVLYPSNPGNRGHAWYKRLFINRQFREKERAEQYHFVSARVHDNLELLARDPEYVARLEELPEPLRSQLLNGDFTAGIGQALEELSWDHHLVPSFTPPSHWTWFGAFDWGYHHPFSFGAYCVDGEGRVYKIDTISLRGKQPHEIAERIRERFDPSRFAYITAGRDIFHEHKARGESIRTISEQMQDYGFYFTPANVARVHGLNNFRAFLSYRGRGPVQADGTRADGLPHFALMDTAGNRRCFDQLSNIVVDPEDPEDALKTDADEMGEGGDDMYDETRYALASRPPRPRNPILQEQTQAFGAEALAHEAHATRLVRNTPVAGGIRAGVLHGELGEMF